MSTPGRLILRETSTAGTPAKTYILSAPSTSASAGRIDIVPPSEQSSTGSTAGTSASAASAGSSSVILGLLAPLLPSNYPDSVSADYTPYQIYDSIQAFASTIAGLLAARAVLTSLGVGSDGDESTSSSASSPSSSSAYSSTATLATLLSIVQESIGRFATIFFAHYFAVHIEAEVKFYRFFADIANDAAFVLDVLSPSLPAPLLRFPALCLASACRAVCGVCGGSSKAILSAHFATRGNIGELNAKDGSQETVVSLLGMWVGGLVVSKVEGRWATWVWLLALLAVHLWANWKAVKSVRLRTLNRARATAVLERAVRGEEGGIGVEEVGRAERLWTLGHQGTIRVGGGGGGGGGGEGKRWTIKFARIEDVLQAMKWERREKSLQSSNGTLLRELLDLFAQDQYVLWLDEARQTVLVVLKQGATSQTQLQSWYHAAILGNHYHGNGSDDDALLRAIAETLATSKRGWKQTEDLLTQQGWQLQDSNLDTRAGARLQIDTD